MMTTINSLSGGKSSSYIAVHYPADYDLFALVCVDSHNAGIRIDPGIKKMVNERLQKYCSHWPEFKATTEDPKVLKAMFDLEQITGREIIWLRGMGWEKMMQVKQAVPNQHKRFCTTIMKMIPVFEWCYSYTHFPVKMRIGYRYDEKERANSFTTKYKMCTHGEIYTHEEAELIKNPIIKSVLKLSKNGGYYYVNRWKEIDWREPDFVLIDDKITHYKVHSYWDKQNIDFPIDSNCQNCFWKDPQQLRMNFDTNPEIMAWSVVMEGLHNHTFKEESLISISNMGIQLDFFYGTGAGCSSSGFCSN